MTLLLVLFCKILFFKPFLLTTMLRFDTIIFEEKFKNMHLNLRRSAVEIKEWRKNTCCKTGLLVCF